MVVAGAPVIDDRCPFAPPLPVDGFFRNTTLYEGEGAIRSLSHHGRYEGQFVASSDDFPGGAAAEFWEHRRWRAGIVAELAGGLRFTHNWNLDTSPSLDGDHFFDKIWDLNLSRPLSDEVRVVVGKQRPLVTREWETPSFQLLTIERSPLVNNVISLPLWGASIVHETDTRAHEFGVYGAALESEFHLPSFEHAGSSWLYRTSRSLNEATRIFFDFQWNDTSTSPGFSETYGAGAYAEIASLGTESRWGRLALTTDLIAAWDRRDFARDDTWGLVLMPSFDLNERLQVVLKATFAEDLRVDRPQRHASRPLVDDYGSFYLGLNYVILEDHLKFVAGYEIAGGKIAGTRASYANESWALAIRSIW